MENHIINFKGIKFYNYDFNKLFSIIDKGGYLVAPAASALTDIDANKTYYNCLKKSDIAILDSGFFCILLRIFKGIKVTKFSGYLFLKNFIKKVNKNKKILLIDPSIKDSKINKLFLKSKNIKKIKSYVSPEYKGKVKDPKLIRLIKKYRPRYIIINLGGGTQELLALYIKKNSKFKITTLCTGAAIAFMTKQQAPINDIIDKFYLGWLTRTLYNPKRYFFRTIKSIRLIKQFFN